MARKYYIIIQSREHQIRTQQEFFSKEMNLHRFEIDTILIFKDDQYPLSKQCVTDFARNAVLSARSNNREKIALIVRYLTS